MQRAFGGIRENLHKRTHSLVVGHLTECKWPWVQLLINIKFVGLKIQSVMWLPCKYENISLIPRTHVKRGGK